MKWVFNEQFVRERTMKKEIQAVFSFKIGIFTLLAIFCLSGIQVSAATSNKGADWMLDGSSYKASLTENKDKNEIVLSNGLISRRFRLAPNAATVGFDNLITGESVIRGVKPEAEVMIDGKVYPVGGLVGQPNYAFLTEAWIDELKANPSAMVFTGYETAAPKEHIQWDRVRYHQPDAAWPPKGVYLRMDYKMPTPAEQDKTIDTPDNSGLGRKQLLFDDFQAVSDVWKRHESKSHPRSSFENEGKLGEIYTPNNTCVFIERTIPATARAIETVINPGTDKSASWGPGLAMVTDTQTIKFNMRPGQPTASDKMEFGVWDGSSEHVELKVDKGPDPTKPWKLRMLIEDETVFCQAGQIGGRWKTCKKVQLKKPVTQPFKIRIGKLDKTGGANDHGDRGEIVRLQVMEFAAYGPIDKKQLAKATKTEATKKKTDDGGVTVSVHYELYDGVPVLSKWITVTNKTDKTVTVNKFKSEILAAVEYSSAVEEKSDDFPYPNVHVETEYAFGSMSVGGARKATVHWVKDPDYHTQVNYGKNNPCLLEVSPDVGPAQQIAAGETFESFRAFILPFDSYERERQGLSLRKMYRIVAPWITENPLMMHVRYADWKTVKNAIDQCAEVGFEMVILTFGSGFNIENDSDEYIAQMKKYADYAKSKGIEIGGYSLLASRRVGGGNDVVMPKGKRPKFGNSPCLESNWGRDYFRKLYEFYPKTGFKLLEHDGSYPGDVCTSTEHPGHKGYDDSQWNQWRKISDYYKFCRANGIYLNVPDFYYLAGANKCGMGYREVNWSLPRAQQVIHTRQNIFDGTWEKTPSMGWMFVPLTQYHGGGAAATIEPLKDHLDHYAKMIVSNLGGGVQACYRGPRLYDTDETKAVVKQWVDWYKAHREVLEGDIIHLRRADGKDLDYWLNVNPGGKEKGLLMVFNPLEQKVRKEITIPLYYTGLDDVAKIRREDGRSRKYKLSRDYSVTLDIEIEANAITWFVIE